MSKDYLLAIGVMTGNSLDGVDVVLSKFSRNGDIEDLASYSLKSPDSLKAKLLKLRDVASKCGGNTTLIENEFNSKSLKDNFTFSDLHSEYIHFVARAVNKLIGIAKNLDQIDLIGFHGQTCAHFPPSIAKTKDATRCYTLQLGNGQELANLTGISVVYDFRSDDIMQGGEGAPLAPVHHEHLGKIAEKNGFLPIAFLNAGNTGNITIISKSSKNNSQAVLGFDVGPCNHFADRLTHSEKNLACDTNGDFGKNGQVNLDLLKLLFEKSVTTKDGENFILKSPPKSSDPEWYKVIPELSPEFKISGETLSFEDRIRTVEYFSAYLFFHSLSLLKEDIEMPCHFALCGGGWNNLVIRDHFNALLNGDRSVSPVLPEHQKIFDDILRRAKAKMQANLSTYYGFDGTYMEARIFADAAVSRIKGEAFSLPATTGVSAPCVLGLIRFPNGDMSLASDTLQRWLNDFNSPALTSDVSSTDSNWSRATAGWSTR